MMIKGATGVAAVAAIGNFLQGWDGGAIAGKKATLSNFPASDPYLYL